MIDWRTLGEIILIAISIIGAIQSYKVGLSKISKELRDYVAAEAKRCHEQLERCDKELMQVSTESSKWRTGFSILSAQTRGQPDRISFSDIETKSLADLKDIRDGISNSK